MNARLFLLKQYDNGDFEIVVSFDEFNENDESSYNISAEVQLNLKKHELPSNEPLAEVEKIAIKKAKSFLSKIVSSLE